MCATVPIALSSTLRIQADRITRDLAVPGSDSSVTVQDPSASTHDYIDTTPLAVATAGAVGAAFVTFPTSVVQIERACGLISAGADLFFRWDGEVAEVLSSLTAPGSSLDTLTLTFGVDGATAVTTTFVSGDSTMALVARRINYAHGAEVAGVDESTSKLRLFGARTGSADAKAATRRYGEISIVSGTALSALGLSVGVTAGAGTDERIGAGPYIRSFPSTSLPRSLEVSGSASSLSLMLAGRAS